ncbi:hypothetical protein [Kitasatospora aureofaciens]|uniref:hypothetical protein n=1 Tax=Kitasatospora aureofaciens TaxID=1894 RepID=UPI0036F484C5
MSDHPARKPRGVEGAGPNRRRVRRRRGFGYRDTDGSPLRDLARRGLGPDRVLGCAIRLPDLGFFRIGAPGYERDNGSYGLTTLRRDQMTVRRGRVHFAYRGGVISRRPVSPRRAAARAARW